MVTTDSTDRAAVATTSSARRSRTLSITIGLLLAALALLLWGGASEPAFAEDGSSVERPLPSEAVPLTRPAPVAAVPAPPASNPRPEPVAAVPDPTPALVPLVPAQPVPDLSLIHI